MKLGEDLLARGDGQGPRGAGPAPGSHRRGQRLGHRLAARAGDGRAALSAAGCRRHDALGRRAPPRGAVPAAAASRPICCCSTSRPTTSTPNRWRGSSASSRNTRAPSSRSRTIATSSTTWPSGFSSSIAAPAFRGRATTRPGSIRSSSGWRRKRSPRRKRQKTLQRELEWIRMSPRARQAKGKARLNAYEQLLNEDTAQKIEQVEIYIPPGPRLGDVVVEARGLRKAYGDQLLMDDLNFTLPRGGIVGVIGPNGAGKTTLFRMITGQEKPDAGTLRLGETVQVGLRRSEPRRARREQERVGRDHRRGRRADDRQAAGRRRAPTSRGSTSRARSSSARSARCRAASATACTWRSCCSAARTCCCSTSRPTTSTSTRCARSKRRC